MNSGSSRSSSQVVKILVIGAYASGLLLALLGVLLVYFGETAETEMELFGQTIKTTNVGIAGIFIGGVAIILLIRRLSKTVEKAIQADSAQGSREDAPVVMKGALRIIELAAHQNDETCLLDFMVKNEGVADVVVLNVELEVMDLVTIRTSGGFDFSRKFNVDVSDLENVGDSVTCRVERHVKPGEAERFGIVLGARRMGLGVFRGWKLLPRLKTDSGDIEGQLIEAWLPTRFLGHSFADAKIEVQRETNPTEVSTLIKQLKASGEDFTSYAVNTIADQLLWAETQEERRDAARALAEIGHPAKEVASMISEALQDSDPEVRKLAAQALERLNV